LQLYRRKYSMVNYSNLECNRRYYHNYYVHKQSSLRIYYGGVPNVIQVAQHFFIESGLLELFANGTVFGWWVYSCCPILAA
jgi:hypothetical protein